MDPERSAILATMYQNDDTPPERAITPNTDQVRRIRVGAIEYEVPTIHYVRHLEQTLATHAIIIERQQRMIEHLTLMMNKSRGSQQDHGRQMDDLRRQMQTKINRSDRAV